jgi:hypothetical protein
MVILEMSFETDLLRMRVRAAGTRVGTDFEVAMGGVEG